MGTGPHCATCTCEEGPACDLCGDALHDGQLLVDAYAHGRKVGQVHSSCAREIEDQAR
jgi:hypothetical protein